MTALATGGPNVAGWVYIAAFGIDEEPGWSVWRLPIPRAGPARRWLFPSRVVPVT
jgi:hypothetical protein